MDNINQNQTSFYPEELNYDAKTMSFSKKIEKAPNLSNLKDESLQNANLLSLLTDKNAINQFLSQKLLNSKNINPDILKMLGSLNGQKKQESQSLKILDENDYFEEF